MGYAFWLLLIFTLPAWSSPAEEPEERRVPILDAIDDFVGNKVNAVANDFDSFFATERADDELGRSRLRIRTNYRVEERALPKDDVQFRFNLKLPYLQQAYDFRLDELKKKDEPEKEGKEGKKVETEQENKLAEQKARELERQRERNKVQSKWMLTGDTSVNVSLQPRAIVRGRLRKNQQTGTLIHRFVQEISWQTDREGFRNRTSFDTDHTFSDDVLFRFFNNVDWKITGKQFTTSHGPSLFHRLSDIDALSYAFGVGSTIVDGIWFMSGYGVSTTYRRRLYKDILYGEVTPSLNFPKQWSFRRTPGLFVQLEFLFGDQ